MQLLHYGTEEKCPLLRILFPANFMYHMRFMFKITYIGIVLDICDKKFKKRRRTKKKESENERKLKNVRFRVITTTRFCLKIQKDLIF